MALAIASLCTAGAWAQTDVTSTYITNADFSSTTGWTQEHSNSYWTLGNGIIGTYAVANSKTSTTDATHLSSEYCLGIQCRWSGNYANFSQTISSLPAGAYTLTFDVQNKNNSTSATYNNLFKVTVGGNTYTDSSTEWMSGSSNWTTHTIEFTLTEAASATISLGYGTGSNNLESSKTPHLYVSHLKLELYPFATSSDYDALNSAIATVEGKTWGFDTDEYAPYNYVEILQALAAAKAIDQTTSNSQATVQALTTTLNGADWSSTNTAEVNAIWDGSFVHDYSSQTGNVQPIGWYRVKGTTGDGYNVRYASTGSFAGVAYTSSDHGLFTKLNAYYGWEDGYTMPLNAETYYTVAFVAGGASDCDDLTNNIDIINPSEETTRIKTYAVPNKTANTDATSASWITVQQIFKTGAAGNYVLGLVPRNSGNKSQNQFLYGDFVLKTTTVAEATAYYNTVKDEVDDDYDASANGGSEKTAFNDALNASMEGKTVAQIMEAAANLYNLRDAFVAATPKYDAYLAEKTNAERIAASITSGVSAPTTAAEAETALQTILVNEYNYVASNFNADAAATYGITIDQWTGTATSGGNSDTPQTNSGEKWGTSATTYYEQGANGWGSNAWTLNYTKTVTLPANTYVMKVAARASTGATATLKATIGGTTITESLPNVGNTGLGITTDGVASFDGNDTFANSDNGYGWQWRYLAFTLENEGEVTLQIDASANSTQQWCSFGDVAVVSNVSTTAMEAAYNNFTMQILGFENGQYAPYNNVTVLEAYAQAKAIVEGTAVPSTQVEVDAITATLTSPTWTANTGDVDAIYNGTFAEGNGNNPMGWTRSNNAWGQQITGLTAEANGVAAGTTTAWYYNTNGAWEYGKDDVYTMPLKGNQLYKLTFKYSKHNSDWQDWMKASVLNADNEGLEVVQFPGAADGTMFQQVTAYFKTEAAGGYVLSIEQYGNAHLTDVSLVKADASELLLGAMPTNYTYYEELTLDRTFSKTNYSTLCLPFEFDASAFEKVYELTNVEGESLKFSSPDAIVAGTPYLVKAKDDATTLTATNVAVNPATSENNTVVIGDVTFVGTFTSVTLTSADSNAWVVSNNNLYNVTSNVNVGAYRAYFTVNASSGVKNFVLSFDDDMATAIEGVEASQNENAVIYNLAGQRVSKLQRGVNIVNGKKVLVK